MELIWILPMKSVLPLVVLLVLNVDCLLVWFETIPHRSNDRKYYLYWNLVEEWLWYQHSHRVSGESPSLPVILCLSFVHLWQCDRIAVLVQVYQRNMIQFHTQLCIMLYWTNNGNVQSIFLIIAARLISSLPPLYLFHCLIVVCWLTHWLNCWTGWRECLEYSITSSRYLLWIGQFACSSFSFHFFSSISFSSIDSFILCCELAVECISKRMVYIPLLS